MTRDSNSVVHLYHAHDQQAVKRLLEANHRSFEEHLAKITQLRTELESEEAKLSFCLYEERRIIKELDGVRDKDSTLELEAQ